MEGCTDGIELAKSVGFELGDSLITEGEIDVVGSKDGIVDGTVDGAMEMNLDPPHMQHASPALFPKLKYAGLSLKRLQMFNVKISAQG